MMEMMPGRPSEMSFRKWCRWNSWACRGRVHAGVSRGRGRCNSWACRAQSGSRGGGRGCWWYLLGEEHAAANDGLGVLANNLGHARAHAVDLARRVLRRHRRRPRGRLYVRKARHFHRQQFSGRGRSSFPFRSFIVPKTLSKMKPDP